MATTAQGTTYVESSDLVSAYPTASLAVANAIDTKATLAMTQNPQTGTSYTAVLADAYKLVTMSNAAASTFTVPPEASVAWPTWTQLRILNIGAGACTITPGAGVTINGTPLAVAQHKGGCLVKTGTNTWTFIPFVGGSAVGTISGTTGSPTTSANGGATAYRWTTVGTHTFTVATAGLFSCRVVGGGGGGGKSVATYNQGAGGGGGQDLQLTDIYLAAGVYNIVVGAGGAANTTATTRPGNGACSLLGPHIAAGGGAQTTPGSGEGGDGANGSGCDGQANSIPGRSVSGGFAGGDTNSISSSGGGGGSGAAGADGVGTTAGAGGAGTASSITGASVTCGGGGGGGGDAVAGAGGTGGGGAGAVTGANATAGTANTGGGGGGSDTGTAGAGGSGVVVLLVGTV